MIASNSRLLAALLLLAPVAARADAPPSSAPAAPTAEQLETARSLYREARELHRQGKLREALERALESYRTAATPVTALEAAQLLVESGRLVEARATARGVALVPPSPRESDKGRDARQDAATLATALDARIPKLAITGRPTGAEVSLDGKPFAGSDPTAWQGLDPGAHSIVVRAGERACATIGVTLAEGETRTIDVHDASAACGLEAAPPPAVVAPALVTPAPPPPAPSAPFAPAEEPRAPGGGNAVRWIGVGVGAAGVIAIGVGGGVALAAKSNYDSVAGQCPASGCTAAAYGVREDARSQGNVATAVMVLGTAAVAGGVLMFVLAPDARESVRVGVGPRGAGVVVPFD